MMTIYVYTYMCTMSTYTLYTLYTRIRELNTPFRAIHNFVHSICCIIFSAQLCFVIESARLGHIS